MVMRFEGCSSTCRPPRQPGYKLIPYKAAWQAIEREPTS